MDGRGGIRGDQRRMGRGGDNKEREGKNKAVSADRLTWGGLQNRQSERKGGKVQRGYSGSEQGESSEKKQKGELERFRSHPSAISEKDKKTIEESVRRTEERSKEGAGGSTEIPAITSTTSLSQ